MVVINGKTYKGKYKGPDKYKGKPPPAKTDKYLTEATQLGTSKYSPVFAQIAANEASNKGAYSTGSSQRINALNAELGSMEAANATTQKKLGDLGTESGTMYQQALAKSQSDFQNQQYKTNITNTNLMSSLQSEMAARGLTGTTAGQQRLATNAAFGNNLAGAVNEINQGALMRQGTNAQDTFGQMKGSGQMLHQTSTSGARGEARSALDQLYNTYLEKELEMQGQKTVTEKEKSDYILQTRMTLKEQAAQAAAAKAQAAAQSAAAAGNLNYKYEALKVGTQYKYDALASKTAQNDIANQLKERGFSHKQAMDIANLSVKKGALDLNWEKFKSGGGTKSGMSNERVAEIIASLGS